MQPRKANLWNSVTDGNNVISYKSVLHRETCFSVMQLSVNTSFMCHPSQQLNLELGQSGHHFHSDGSLPAFTEAVARKQEEGRRWWKKWQVSDRCLEGQAAGGMGEGRSVLASEVQCSATGEEMPGWKIDAPWWHWQADVTQVRVRVWGPSRLLTAASLLLSDRCTERQPYTGDNSIMCVHLHKHGHTHAVLWSRDNTKWKNRRVKGSVSVVHFLCLFSVSTQFSSKG